VCECRVLACEDTVMTLLEQLDTVVMYGLGAMGIRRTRRSSMICQGRHQQPKVPWYGLPSPCVVFRHLMLSIT
jgi:hypothetical protein